MRLRTGEWVSIADFDDAFFPIHGIIDYAVTMSSESEADRMDILMDSGPQTQVDAAAVAAAALSALSIRRAVEQGRLIIGSVDLGVINQTTTGAAKKTIVRQWA